MTSRSTIATASPGEASSPPPQAQIDAVGRRLAAAMPQPAAWHEPTRALDELLMRTASADRGLRTALFRFVDVRPACRTRRDLAEHLLALLADSEPAGRNGRIASALAANRLTRPLVVSAAGLGVARIAHRFIVGESISAAAPTLSRLWKANIGASVDLLGEATLSEEEADRYTRRCLSSLEALSGAVARWPAHARLERDSIGAIPRANLSVKISALTPQIRAEDPQRGIEGALARLRAVLRRARDLHAHVHVDMESLDSRETVLELTLRLLAEREFREGPSAGLVLQAYLRDSSAELDQIMRWVDGHARTPPLTIRLVKGAYWDHEVVEARRHGWAVPVYERREECDQNFELLTRRLLHVHPRVRLAVASHNLRSIAHAIASLPAAHLAESDIEFQVLRGLGDDIGHALAAMDSRVRTYCPVGDLVEGMAYLVRRMLENTANDSFLAAQAAGVGLDELLAPPGPRGPLP
jgi:proline dehydrogenase